VELHYNFPAQQEQSTTNTLGAVPKKLPRRGGILHYIREDFRGRERVWWPRSFTSRYVRNSEEDDSIITRVFIFIGVLDQPPPQLPTGAPRVTTRNRSGVTKHSNIPYRETTFDDKIMRGFNEAVRMPASSTDMDYRDLSGDEAERRH